MTIMFPTMKDPKCQRPPPESHQKNTINQKLLILPLPRPIQKFSQLTGSAYEQKTDSLEASASSSSSVVGSATLATFFGLQLAGGVDKANVVEMWYDGSELGGGNNSEAMSSKGLVVVMAV
ncbi:hypothetical protein NE237_029185 [Protea cynaroides]|uniref:Uncharacterized protein n=1 Tax=Protea cynaroides TaxID=273540 RepID=A0A9Q0JW15_9MAGN|nr:hypothetical protein NE237_029185 [Protea cynaroides]